MMDVGTMETNQITWRLIQQSGYLAQWKLAVRNSLEGINTMLRAAVAVLKSYFTLIGMDPTGVAIMTVSKHRPVIHIHMHA